MPLIVGIVVDGMDGKLIYELIDGTKEELACELLVFPFSLTSHGSALFCRLLLDVCASSFFDAEIVPKLNADSNCE